MGLELSATAELLSQKTNIEQQIILEIDGIDLIFAAVSVTKLAKYGDLGLTYGQSGLVYGGTILDERERTYISLSGTTRNIQQQIDPTRSGATSVQAFNVRLVDKGQELTRVLSPGNTVDDVLSRKANVYIAFRGGAHPEDSILILQGNVDQLRFGAGHVDVRISHPENLKRSILLPAATSELSAGIDASVTTIPVDNTNNFAVPADALRSFIKIDDEIIEWTGKTSTTFTSATRGALGTTAAVHSIDAEVTSFYKLTEKPIPLALKIMLSNGGDPYKEEVETPNFVQVDPLTTTANGVYIADTTFASREGVTVGDTITITGASNGANNVTDAPIIQINIIATGTVFVLSGVSLVVETDSAAIASFTSQYNTLPIEAGANLSPSQVDIERHQFWLDLFPNTFPTLEIDLEDEFNAKEFINEQIYFPVGFFPVPRKGRVSVNYSIPPLLEQDSAELDENNVKDPDKLKILRSTNNNFFNAITYKYEKDAISGNFTQVNITQSARSTNRIPTRNKPLEIEATGFRNNAETVNFITNQTRRFLDRYQFSAESISVETNYKTGFKIEVGDSLILSASNLKVTDVNNETRDFAPRIMEVVNKDLSLTTGKIKLSLLDTAFQLDVRFGIFSPSSKVGPSATINTVPIKRSFSTQAGQDEERKWEQYIGENIEIHNPDYSTLITATFIGFDPGNPNVMLVDNMSGVPAEDLVVDMPKYPTSTNSRLNEKWKAAHVFSDPEVSIVSGVSTTSFTVGAGDIAKFIEGQPVRVHSLDFTIDSTPDLSVDNLEVIDVTGVTVTVDRDMGFTPSAGQVVNLIGFADSGKPYAYF